MRNESALNIWPLMTFAALAPVFATALEVNSNRFSFSSAMPQCKRQNDTSDADRISERRSMIDS
jgi:hypothetical protein